MKRQVNTTIVAIICLMSTQQFNLLGARARFLEESLFDVPVMGITSSVGYTIPSYIGLDSWAFYFIPSIYFYYTAPF